jgi:methylmalonyl-CoA/ethylmalonyl-CoA epimerase
MNVESLDHIGIAVRDADRARAFYAGTLGLEDLGEEIVASMNLRVVKVRVGTTVLELLEPLEGEAVVRAFIERRGEGIHHVCFGVADVRAAAREAGARGCRALWPDPKLGAGGRRVNFLHPRDTGGVLIELSQP